MAADQARLPQQTRVPPLALAGVLIVAALLRVGALDKPFYVDEITTITVAAQPLDRMAEVMRLIDASPALYPLLLHAWIGIGHADAWLRLLPALFGWLAVVVVWTIGRDAFGWRTGLAAAAVMAIAPAHVHYAQYVRNYSLFTLLAAVHLLLFGRLLTGAVRPRIGPLAALALTTAALLYTHYLSLLLFPAEALVAAFLLRSRPRVVAGLAAAMIAGAIAFLPGVPLLQHNLTFDRVRNLERPEPPPLVELVPTLAAELTVGQRALGFDDPTVQRVTLAAAVLVVPGLALVGLVSGVRQRPVWTALLVTVAVLPVAFYVGSGRRLVAVRFFLPFMVGYVVLAGHGLAMLRPRVAALAAAVLVVICAIPLTHFFTSYAWSYDHAAVARRIRERAAPGDVLLVVHPFEGFYYRWYLDDAMPIEGLVFTALEEQDKYVIKPPALDLPEAERRVQAAARTHPRFWVVGQSMRSFASDAGREAALFAWLDAHYDEQVRLDDLTGGDPRIRAYAAPVPTTDVPAPAAPARTP